MLDFPFDRIICKDSKEKTWIVITKAKDKVTKIKEGTHTLKI